MNTEINEMDRQCKMAWKRGYEFGLVKGGAIVLLLAVFAAIIF